MKKIFTLFVALAATLTVMAQSNAYNLKGTGTEADPYQIATANDFDAVAKAITADNTGAGEFFKITDDLDFTGFSFAPIAYTGGITAKNATVKFAGTFDGDNHLIKNLTYNNADGSCAALFGTVDAAGVVKNIKVDASCSFSGKQYVAAIVGMLLGKVSNCDNAANITASGTAAAGIVGNVQAGAVVEGCSNSGSIQAATYAAGCCGMTIGAAEFTNLNNSGAIRVVGSVGTTGAAGAAQHAAGIIGGGAGACKVKGCVNSGTVTNNGFDATLYPTASTEKLKADSNGSNAGGIVGYTTASYDITECTNDGTVTGLLKVGGIIGNTTKAVTITSCVNNGTVTATGDASLAGQIAGTKDNITATACIVGSPYLPLDTLSSDSYTGKLDCMVMGVTAATIDPTDIKVSTMIDDATIVTMPAITYMTYVINSFDIPVTVSKEGDKTLLAATSYTTEGITGSSFEGTIENNVMTFTTVFRYGGMPLDLTATFNSTVSGINNVTTATPADGNKMYNISGQRVNDSQKGIVIINGKKYVK